MHLHLGRRGQHPQEETPGRSPAFAYRQHATQAAAPPRVFTHIKLTYAVRGKLSRKAVEDAVSLSKNKYCSVSKMLEKAATIEYEIVYPDGEPEP